MTIDGTLRDSIMACNLTWKSSRDGKSAAGTPLKIQELGRRKGYSRIDQNHDQRAEITQTTKKIYFHRHRISKM